MKNCLSIIPRKGFIEFLIGAGMLPVILGQTNPPVVMQSGLETTITIRNACLPIN